MIDTPIGWTCSRCETVCAPSETGCICAPVVPMWQGAEPIGFVHFERRDDVEAEVRRLAPDGPDYPER